MTFEILKYFQKFVNFSMILMLDYYYHIIIKGDLRFSLGLDFRFGDINFEIKFFVKYRSEFLSTNIKPQSEYKAVGEQFMVRPN